MRISIHRGMMPQTERETMTLEIANSVLEAIKILKKAQFEVSGTSQAVWDKVYNAHKHLDKELRQFVSGE